MTIAAGALVETFAGGTALVHGAVHNSGGTLFASGASSLIEILSGTVVSGGLVEIGNGTIDVRSGGTASVFFTPTGSGGLIIADTSGSTAAYTGTVSGFGGMNHANVTQFIELANVSSGASLVSSYLSTGRTAARCSFRAAASWWRASSLSAAIRPATSTSPAPAAPSRSPIRAA